MTARRATRAAGLLAVVLFLVTAGRAIVRMGPRPDGTCGMDPTCPSSHQWVALLVLAGLCLVLAFVSFAVRTRRWGVAIALLVALAVAIVDPPDHLNSPRADWFGHPFSDGRLN
jgi:hypothetical protein